MELGFVGLGIMGTKMASNLARGGHRLHLYARRESALAPFRASAVVHASPAEVARAAEVVFTIVGDTTDVEEVVFGRDASVGTPALEGLAAGFSPGKILVDMTTASPAGIRSIAERLRARGVAMLDAPVSGGEVGAEQGTLSIMIGGDADVVARVAPLFALLGKNVVHVGPSGAGQVAKACNQILAAVTIEGVAEAMVFASRNGVDAGKVRDALLGGFAYSRVLEIHGKRMLDEAFAPGFKARHHDKDMRIVEDASSRVGLSLPCTRAASARIAELVARGGGELDSSAVRTLFDPPTNSSE